MVYNYTKPRAPIAAMNRGPGPCYELPTLTGRLNHDPRSIHNRGPAFAFGVHHSKPADNASPGPVYFPDSKIYRDGHDGTPRYSLYARRTDLVPFNVPGPGTYTTDQAGPMTRHKAPAYSFGAVCAPQVSDQTPAPNVYSTPSTLGKTIQSDKKQAPCYSIYGRSKTGSFHEDLQKTPGPGAYTMVNPNQYMKKLPQYSITGRNMMPGDPTLKPGPGDHYPEKVTMTKHQTPRYSFGIRHSEYSAPLIVEQDSM